MWGISVIVPESLQSKLLDSLHKNHPGMTRINALVHSYFWWTGLDKAIEDRAKSCVACQAIQASPAPAPLHPWVWPDAPWKRIHIDFVEPFLGKIFLTASDRYNHQQDHPVLLSLNTFQTVAT